MPPKKKQHDAEAESSGVSVRPPRAVRYEDGVAVRTPKAVDREVAVVTPDAPEQTAGANDGQSAGTQKEKD